jgi:hypothetical protein
VSGKDAEQMGQAVGQFGLEHGLAIERGAPTLEDAFIHLMRDARDQYE